MGALDGRDKAEVTKQPVVTLTWSENRDPWLKHPLQSTICVCVIHRQYNTTDFYEFRLEFK